MDEAGRGPVLGSLVYCAAFWPVSESESIEKLGFNDSKQLKESQRDDFFTMISSHQSIGWVIEELTPEKISEVGMKHLLITRYPTSVSQCHNLANFPFPAILAKSILILRITFAGHDAHEPDFSEQA